MLSSTESKYTRLLQRCARSATKGKAWLVSRELSMGKSSLSNLVADPPLKPGSTPPILLLAGSRVDAVSLGALWAAMRSLWHESSFCLFGGLEPPAICGGWGLLTKLAVELRTKASLSGKAGLQLLQLLPEIHDFQVDQTWKRIVKKVSPPRTKPHLIPWL